MAVVNSLMIQKKTVTSGTFLAVRFDNDSAISLTFLLSLDFAP